MRCISLVEQNDEPIAYKFNDPVEPARLVYDEDDLDAIRSEDPSLLLCVGDRVEKRGDSQRLGGRVLRLDANELGQVAWDDGSTSWVPLTNLRVIQRS